MQSLLVWIPFWRLLARWLCLALAFSACASAAHAAKFHHAALGVIDIYTSESPEVTTRFVAELLAVRRQIQDLAGAVPLPTPRMQILVFRNRNDYRDFIPQGMTPGKDEESVSGFTANEYALTVAIVKSDVDEARFGRDAVLYFYAQYLIRSAFPRAPLWVVTGLPEVLAGVAVKREQIFLGADFMNHASAIRPKSFLPLAELTDDAAMQKHLNAPKHDNALYHEAWALWHQWLTAPDGRRRAQIRSYFAALRNGEKGNFATVAAAFGEPAEVIEKAHRSRTSQSNLRTIKLDETPAQLAAGLNYQPATEVDALSATALVFAATGKGLGALGFALLQAAEKYPGSPRLQEALAVLATGERNTETAAIRWERARELGTDNPYAYLLAARTALQSRQFRVTLRPELTEERAEMLRALVDRSLALNPSQPEAHYYRLLVESFAPSPRKAAVDATDREQVVARDPSAMFYLAIARWRLGETEVARAVIKAALEQPELAGGLRSSLHTLRAMMSEGTHAP